MGSASVSLHNNVLVLSPERPGPRLLETRGPAVWKPLMAGSEPLGSDLQRAGGSGSCTETCVWLIEDFLCRWNHTKSFSGHCLTKNYPDDPVLPPGFVLKVVHARQCASGCG